MKSQFIILIFTLFFQTVAFSQTQSIRLFQIDRNKNKNIVCYDVNIKDNGIDKDNAIKAYWKREDGKIEELGGMERRMAYGTKVISCSAKLITFKLSAYDKQNITVSYDAASNKATAKIAIKGIPSRLEKIYINAKAPLYTSVSYMELFGSDLKTGQKTYEKIIND